MGRLFWKFFAAVLLAQITTFVGVGALLWLTGPNFERVPVELGAGPHEQHVLEGVAATLVQADDPAAALAAEWTRARLGLVYVIDDQGRDLLGRTLAPQVIERARRLAQTAAAQPQAQPQAPQAPQPQPQSQSQSQAPQPQQPQSQPPQSQSPPPQLRPPRPPPGPRGDRPPPDGHGEGEGFGPPRFAPHESVRLVRAGDARDYLIVAFAPLRPPGERALFSERAPLPVMPFVAAFFASLVFGALLAWYFATPIRILRTAFDEAARGNLALRVAPLIGTRSDELADLGRYYDRTTDQLRALMDGQRRLLHDVSHELRSPLARLQAAIGLARQQPEQAAASLDRIEREAERIDELVGELLTLARLEAGVPGGATERVDLAELLGGVVEDARFESARQPRRVVFDAPAPVFVQARPELLHRAFENVVRNALLHTGPDGDVEISMARSGDARVSVRVRDHGPGVSAAVLAHMFEPFVRGEGGGKSDGHGLGLAIARRVVESMGGSIAARNRDDGGLEVEIVLPLAAAAAAG